MLKLLRILMFKSKKSYHSKQMDSLNTGKFFDVFLTVHHSIDFSKYQLSAQFF